jgi:hypothetical protein
MFPVNTVFFDCLKSAPIEERRIAHGKRCPAREMMRPFSTGRLLGQAGHIVMRGKMEYYRREEICG